LLLLSCALAALFAVAVALLHAVLFGIPVTRVADPEPHVTELVMDLYELQNYVLSKSGYVSRNGSGTRFTFILKKFLQFTFILKKCLLKFVKTL
jgi:hypothetical protein